MDVVKGSITLQMVYKILKSAQAMISNTVCYGEHANSMSFNERWYEKIICSQGKSRQRGDGTGWFTEPS